jgi:hypothetical protein
VRLATICLLALTSFAQDFRATITGEITDKTGAPRGKHITNQFSGTLGGPLKRDKDFLFFSFEGDQSGRHEVVQHYGALEAEHSRRGIQPDESPVIQGPDTGYQNARFGMLPLEQQNFPRLIQVAAKLQF